MNTKKQNKKQTPSPRNLAFLSYYTTEPYDETPAFCLLPQRLVVKSHQEACPIAKLNVLLALPL